MPKLRFRLRNDATRLERSSVYVETVRYAGELAAIGQIKEGWFVSAQLPAEGKPWSPGEARKYKVRLDPLSFPEIGSYAVRIRIARWDRSGVGNERSVFVVQGANSYMLNDIFAGTIIGRFTLEPVSSALTFLIALGTLALAVATVVLAIVTAVK